MTSFLLMLNCLGFLVVAVLAIAVYLQSKERALLPPGPKAPHFFSGNAKQLYQPEIWKSFAAWGREYGPLTYLRIFTQHMIVLNTESAVLDLLDKRSSIYSDRSKQYMYQELMGRKNSAFNISSEHEWFKKYRRLMASELNRSALSRNGGHNEVIQHEIKVLLEGIRDRPAKFQRLLRRNTGAIIMKIAYGYTVNSDDDRFLDIVEEGNSLADRFAAPGRWLVDYYPILRYIPAWFPGGGFKRVAAEHKAHLVNMTNYPHNWVKQQLAKGNIVGGFTSKKLKSEDQSVPEHEDVIKNVAAGLYAGGGETTVSAMNTFIYIMTTHPHIQALARGEVDAVIGHDRLVTIEDWERLQRHDIEMPYLAALTKEILRWGTVAPLGLTHLTTKEDEYMGYRIPKGTAVIANIWGLLHDPVRYPDPYTFNPDRFLSTPTPSPSPSLHSPHIPQQDPTSFAFGFGRRVCPGATFAQTSLFLTLVSLLQTFEFRCPVDPVSGKEVVPVCEFSSSIVRHIKPYQTRIIPRVEAESLLD